MPRLVLPRLPSSTALVGVLLLLATAATPAAAEWTRVAELPATDFFSVWANGDTIAAGADTAAWISTDGGTTWKVSARLAPAVNAVQAVRVRNGRVYAGTSGQGVWTSDDFGDTWTAYNQGLVGGIGNSQLHIMDLLFVGDSLYAATSGAGPWVRRITAPSTWGHFGENLEPNQASNMNAIAHGGTRFLAAAGFNGTVFFRDHGQPDWTLSWLGNTGALPGLGALTAHWTGTGWIVGSNIGVFISPTGQSPWTFVDVGFGTLFSVSFAQRGGEVFASFGVGSGAVIERSIDGGATWEFLDDLSLAFTYEMKMSGNTLYSARFDGLWRREVETVSVPPGTRAGALRFAIAGAQPVREDVRFAFTLPEAGPVRIEVFDLAGRAMDRIEGAWPAGASEIRWSARALAPGIYHARLSAAGRSESVKLVRVH